MSKVYGYARISTAQQSIERQVRNIIAEYPNAKLYQEAFTGTKIDRPEFSKLLKVVKAGDTIVFDSVSRMSRNAEEGFALYQELFSKGVSLVFLKERNIDTSVYSDAMKAQLPTISTSDADADNMVNAILKAVQEYTYILIKKQFELAFEQAEKEVTDLRQRTAEGIETARQAGKQVGQVAGAKLHVKKAEKAKELILKHNHDFGGNLSDEETISVCKVSRNSFYKYKAELRG